MSNRFKLWLAVLRITNACGMYVVVVSSSRSQCCRKRDKTQLSSQSVVEYFSPWHAVKFSFVAIYPTAWRELKYRLII